MNLVRFRFYSYWMILDLKIQFWWSLGYDHKEDTTCKNHYGGVFHDREDAFNHCQNSPSCGGFFNVHCANEYFHLCPIDSEMSSGDSDCLDSKRGSNIINIHWNSQLLVMSLSTSKPLHFLFFERRMWRYWCCRLQEV